MFLFTRTFSRFLMVWSVSKCLQRKLMHINCFLLSLKSSLWFKVPVLVPLLLHHSFLFVLRRETALVVIVLFAKYSLSDNARATFDMAKLSAKQMWPDCASVHASACAVLSCPAAVFQCASSRMAFPSREFFVSRLHCSIVLECQVHLIERSAS